MPWVLNLGRQAVTNNHDPYTVFCKHLANHAVLPAITGSPTAAMNEEKDRVILMPFRQKKVELMFFWISIFVIKIRDIPKDLNFEASAGFRFCIFCLGQYKA